MGYLCQHWGPNSRPLNLLIKSCVVVWLLVKFRALQFRAQGLRVCGLRSQGLRDEGLRAGTFNAKPRVLEVRA